MRLQQELRSIKSHNRIVMSSGITAEVAVDELKEFLLEDKTRMVKLKYLPVPSVSHKYRTSEKPQTAALNLGDWHIAEVVNPLAVNGMNKHNTLIGAGKIWRIVEKFVKIVRSSEVMHPIEDLWVPLLGDFTSGSIHKELILTNDLLDIPATVLASRLIICVLNRLKCLGKPIRVDAVVGNHPRQTETMPTKVQATTNFDWLCYTMVQSHFEDDEQVRVHVHLSQQAFVEIRGQRIVLDHGYGYKHERTNELDTKMRNIFDHPDVRAAVNNASGTSLDFIILGDKHRAKLEDFVMVNGSLPGASEITTAWRLKPIRAVQQAYGISQEQIPTWYYGLTAHYSQCEAVDNPLSKYVQSYMTQYGR